MAVTMPTSGSGYWTRTKNAISIGRNAFKKELKVPYYTLLYLTWYSISNKDFIKELNIYSFDEKINKETENRITHINRL